MYVDIPIIRYLLRSFIIKITYTILQIEDMEIVRFFNSIFLQDRCLRKGRFRSSSSLFNSFQTIYVHLPSIWFADEVGMNVFGTSDVPVRGTSERRPKEVTVLSSKLILSNRINAISRHDIILMKCRILSGVQMNSMSKGKSLKY
jgi:hypothetical protein